MERVILGVVLVLAVYYDRGQNRIPNRLCAAGMAVGTLYLSCFHGMSVVLFRCLWAAGLLICFFPLWRMKAVGAGDIKLFMAAGLLLGGDSLSFLISTGICLGIHAFLLMICRRNYFQRMTEFIRYLSECIEQKCWKEYPFDRDRDYASGGIRMSYGLLAGHLLAMLTGMYN